MAGFTFLHHLQSPKLPKAPDSGAFHFPVAGVPMITIFLAPCLLSALKLFSHDSKPFRINGGDDGARTRDLCRDRAAL